MSEVFDIGPLSWVKEEIDQSLSEVVDCYRTVAATLDAHEHLQFAMTHLYQVNGALDMVGLEGCKRYCAELETLTTQLFKGNIDNSQQIMEDLILAVQTLSQYLQDLMNGMPDTPLRLFDSLSHLVTLQNNVIEPTYLFFPETDADLPDDLPTAHVDEGELSLFIAEQRGGFQKALLRWLMHEDDSAIVNMRVAVESVQKVVHRSQYKQLWWAATAFIDALNQAGIAALNGAKKLCRRLDQQLKVQSLGDAKIQSNLLRDVLYYVAISAPDTTDIVRVKQAFALDATLPNQTIKAPEILLVTDAERDAVQQLLAELPQLKALWVSVSDHSHDESLDKQIPLEELQGVSIKLQFLLENMQSIGVNQDNPNNLDLISLLETTQKVSQKLLGEIDRLNETAALEVATGLNLLEGMATSYEKLDIDYHEKVVAQIARLTHIIEAKSADDMVVLGDSGAPEIEPSDLDDSVVAAVAEQILEGLRGVEKLVDAFFRKTSNTKGLLNAVRPLTQVMAAFDMLEMPTAKNIAKLSILYVEQFKANAPKYDEPHPNIAQFNVFAEGLSLLGLFAKDLPEVRDQSKQAMYECLQRLEQGLGELVTPSDEEDFIDIADESIDDRRVADRRDAMAQSMVAHERAMNAPKVSEPEPVEEEQHFVEIARFSDEAFTDKAIDLELQNIFIEEAEALLASNVVNLQVLRENEGNNLAVADVRRAFHTLKGSGRTVGLEAMGDVAHAVEKLLNVMIEHQALPTPEIIHFVENTNAAFIEWVSTLKDTQAVTLVAGQYQQTAAELSTDFSNQLAEEKPKARKEEVLIGGSRRVGRAFFYLFLGEAQQHLKTLITARKTIKPNSNQPPSAGSCRAAHTLSSNALTAGFDAIGDLARALENWLDEFHGVWTDKQLNLYGKTLSALKDGLEKAKNLQHPKSTRSLIIELSKSTASMQVMAAKQDETGETRAQAKQKLEMALSSNELMGSELSIEELAVDDKEDAEVDDESEPEIDLFASDALAKLIPTAPAVLKKAIQAETKVVRHALPPIEAKVTAPKPEEAPQFAAETAPMLVSAEQKPTAEVSLNADAAPISNDKVVETEAIAEPEPLLVKESAPVDAALTQLFVEEASELVPQIGRNLRQWKARPSADSYSEALQRDLHTLKGSARTAGHGDIGDRVHELEDRLLNVLSHEPTTDDFDRMFADFDSISVMLEDLLASLNKDSDPIDELGKGVKVDAAASVEAVNANVLDDHQPEVDDSANVDLTSSFLRVRASMLDRLINEAGEVSILRSRMDREMVGFKQSSTDLTLSVNRLRTYLQELEVEADMQLQSRKTALQELNATFDPLELDRFTRLQELTRLMAESLNDVSTVQQNLIGHIDQTDAALTQQNRMNREVQKGLMMVRMMPFSSISERLHRIVRQISRELNKRVELTIEGEEIELDRSVLDKMGGPLEHLLRNAVAHGLEAEDARIQAGKPAVGHIALTVSVEDDEITLTITDDGRGVDLNKVQRIAIERGLLAADQQINDETLIAVIFESGFSTEEHVSKVAGRGVGLDAVKSDIAALNGRIDLSNRPNAGVTFNIYLPVSLSVTQVVAVKVKGQQFLLPAGMIDQVQTLKQAELANVYASQKVTWESNEYPLHFLARLIGDAQYIAKTQAYTPVVLLRSGQHRNAIHVDEVVGNQEIVMKSMGTQLTRVPGIVGATVMPDGAIVYVINPVQLAHREALTVGAMKATAFAPVERAKKIALVVDDSLTMRKALSRILEREGFEVVVANDGVDAIQKLEDVTPDIILTDIEMPRMDGFEFVKNIKNNAVTKALPLIMISSRTATKHQRLAKEIGVDAFLGKPVQDEALIESVGQLLNIKK